MQVADALRLAIRHFNAGRAREGGELCEAILRALPDNPIANTLLARERLRTGKSSDARHLVDAALRAAADYGPALDLDARLRDEFEGDDRIAVDRAYRRALIVGPATSATWFARANLVQGALGDAATALPSYRRARVIAPNDPAVAMNQATAALKLGDTGGALTLCEAVLAHRPTHIRALALKTTALFDLGQPDEANRLTGFKTLTRAMTLPLPDGYDSMDAFNHDFAAAIRAHPARRNDVDPTKRAIRGGSLVTDLLNNDAPAIRAFRGALDGAIATYMSSLPDDPDHPHIAAKPKGYALDAWANILHAEGHQDGHIHNLGWLSGVYYVEVPPSVRDDDADHQGWIEFNRPGYGIPDNGRATVQRLRPVAGMIALFPSYVWHRTVPFGGTGERISVAFDLHPR